MLIFNPSKMKFFKKDDDGEQDSKDEGVKTFFDTLNLKGGGPGGKEKEEGEEENEEEEDAEDDDSDDDDDDDEPKLSPEFIAMQKQLEDSQAQTAKLLAMLEKKDEPKEDDALENPFENESFDNLAEAMDWDDSERKAMKAFMQNALDYQSQTTLTNATAGIDDIVNSKMSQAEKKKAVQKQFFAENPKLKPVKDYVSTVASGVLKEYKALGKTLNPAEILKEAASRAYKVLGIDPKTKNEDDDDPKSERDSNPAFPSSRTNSKKRSQKVNKTTTQKMITSMIDL